MKLWILITGMILGFLIADNVSTQQRVKVRKLARSAQSGRAASVAATVGAGIGDIADAATERVTDTFDHMSSNVADRVSDPA